MSVAAAVLPGRAGPLLSGCGCQCTDCSVQLAVPEFLESEQRRPLALAARRRSLRPGSLRSASRLFEPPRRDPGPGAAPGRPLKGGFKAWDSNFRNPAAPSFRGYYQGSESKEPQSIK